MASTQQVMLAYYTAGGYYIRFYDDFDSYPTGTISGLASGYHILSSGPIVRRVTTGIFGFYDYWGWDDFDSYQTGVTLPFRTSVFTGVNSGVIMYNGMVSYIPDAFGWDDFDSYATGSLTALDKILSGTNSGVSLYSGYYANSGSIPD